MIVALVENILPIEIRRNGKKTCAVILSIITEEYRNNVMNTPACMVLKLGYSEVIFNQSHGAHHVAMK